MDAKPGDEHFVVAFVGSERAVEPCSLPLNELLLARAQDRADAAERVVLASAVAVPSTPGRNHNPLQTTVGRLDLYAEGVELLRPRSAAAFQTFQPQLR